MRLLHLFISITPLSCQNDPEQHQMKNILMILMMMMMMMTMMMVMSCWGVYYDKASSGASHSSKRYLGTLPPHPVTSTKYPTEIKPHIVDSIGKGAYIAILLCLITICCHTRCPKG